SNKGPIAFLTAFIGFVVVLSKSYDGRPPHFGRVTRKFLHDLQQVKAVLFLLFRIGKGMDEFRDVGFGTFGFYFCHDRYVLDLSAKGSPRYKIPLGQNTCSSNINVVLFIVPWSKHGLETSPIPSVLACQSVF